MGYDATSAGVAVSPVSFNCGIDIGALGFSVLTWIDSLTLDISPIVLFWLGGIFTDSGNGIKTHCE